MSKEDDLVGRIPDTWLKPLPVGPPEEPQEAFTERLPPPEVTQAVPESWLRPVPFDTLLTAPGDELVGRAPPEDELVGRAPPPPAVDGAAVDEEDLAGRSGISVQLKWVTPIQLLIAAPQSVQNGAKRE